jgi:hypothetical protein
MRIWTAGLLSLALAGCGQSQDPAFIGPGEWEITNGYPGWETTSRQCFTKEQIAKPELGVFHFDNPGCSKDRFTVAGGRISFALACGMPDESKDGVRMTGEGRYDSKSFEIRVHRALDEDGREAVIHGEWKGQCQASGES